MNKRTLKFYSRVMLLTVTAAAFSTCLMLQTAAAEPKMKRADLNGDGSKESNIYYDETNKIVKIVMDKNHDGRTDCTVFYRNGYRDTAEIDVDYDGIIDTIILYYFTGVPASIAVDRDHDGRPDSWTYFKNGFVYKREWDRNHDGIPDYRILFDAKADYRMSSKTQMQRITKQYDNNYDGYFEKTVKTRKRSRLKKVAIGVGSLSEVYD